MSEKHINARKYDVNRDYFENIDDEEKAYFLGFLYADGHITKDGYALMIQLQERDSKILNLLKDKLNYTGKLSERTIKNKKYYGLRIFSKKIVSDLARHGLTSNKTKNPQIPSIRNDLFPQFLRGFIDGDGTIYVGKYKNGAFRSSVGILVHQNLLNFITKNIKIFVDDFTFCSQPHWRTPYLKCISINGNKKVFHFLNFLYKGANIFLERKYQKYLEVINYYKTN